MYASLRQINEFVFQRQELILSIYEPEAESRAYDACRFLLNEGMVLFRKAKITPKKIGQFVTCWKRKVLRA